MHKNLGCDSIRTVILASQVSVASFLSQKTADPIMCSYKLVQVSFDVWGIGNTIQTHVHQVRYRLSAGTRSQVVYVNNQLHASLFCITMISNF